MDLDETVIDNSGLMAMLLRSGLAYDQRLWDDWEENYPDYLALVPGAKEFILEAKRLNIAVFYISNRQEKFRAKTKPALEALLGTPVGDDFLKLRTGTGDKTERFNQVTAQGYKVLLYVGDNLRDFDNNLKFRPLQNDTDQELNGAINDRKAAVDKVRDKLGTDWIILPNSSYGEWLMGPLSRGLRDLDRLVPEAKPSAPIPVVPPPPQAAPQKACAMQQAIPFILGYLLSMAVGPLLLWSTIAGFSEEERLGRKRRSLIILAGIADGAIYTTLFIVNQPAFVAVWLAFKIAAVWMKTDREERSNSSLFMIGNAVSLVIAYIGAWVALARMPLM